jgi:hypothetical protein
VKQHTSPFEQLSEVVHERAAPPWHCPMPVHAAVVPPPPGPRATPSCAQHTWVAASHVELPHAMPPLLDIEPPLDVDPDSPLLDTKPPLDVDPDSPPLDPDTPLDVDPDSPPLDPDTPLDVDPDPPPPDPEPLADVTPEPLLDPDPLVDASPVGPTPGIGGAVPSSRELRSPHPTASNKAMVESVLTGFMGGVAAPGWRG